MLPGGRYLFDVAPSEVNVGDDVPKNTDGRKLSLAPTESAAVGSVMAVGWLVENEADRPVDRGSPIGLLDRMGFPEPVAKCPRPRVPAAYAG